jgi:Conjugal transfer protein TraD
VTDTSTKQAERVARATQRLAALKAQQLMREMREQHRARQRARRLQERRRLELGAAVAVSGVDHLSFEELVGMLLDAKERLGSSPTMMLGMRKKGAEWLDRSGTPIDTEERSIEEVV